MAFPKISGLAAFACPLLLTGVSAAAESGDEDKERLNVEEEIVVTGSRIHRKDLTTPAPVRVITREQIDQSGRFSIGDFLQLMPEQGNAMNTQVNNSPSLYTGDGSTRISLRSLGESRTLVLVNGRRFVSAGFGSADSSGDLNSIPGTAIERIEVLKDGASAIYGSDSMGGVVNIITRRRFAATEVEAFGGVSAHGDGQLLGITGTTGVSGDRGNALISASFYDQQSVGAGDRSFSSSGLLYDAVNGVTIPQQGSGNVPQGRFLVPAPGTPVPNPDNDSRIAVYNQLVTTYPNAASFIHDPVAALGWRPFDVAKDTYNYQPENYNLTPSRRIALFSTGDLNVGHRARAYYEASYVNRQAEQQLAPDVYATDSDFAVVSSANHYNPFGIDLQAVRTRLMDAGDRRFRQNVDSFRGVAGIDGTLPLESGPLEGWFWDVSLNYSHSAAVTVTSGEHNPEHTPQAVGPSWVDDFGKAHCGTPGTMIRGCVPLDLFHGTPSLSAEQTAYTLYSGTNRGIDQLTQIQASLSGDLFHLASERPAGFAAGYEYRLVHGAFTPDQVRVAQGGDVTSGGYYVNEGYAELSLPILSGVPAVHALEAMAAGRVFSYSTVGGGATYKLGGRWSVARDFTVRGTYSTAFRAPAISESFTPQHVSEQLISDPCSGFPTPIDNSSPRAQNCGPAANNGEFETAFLLTSGGNPQLKPETAKIYTVGIVLEPSFIRELSLTVDYYNISIADAISTAGSNVILSRCYPDRAGVEPALCDRVTRDPVTHLITGIRDVQMNLGATRTDGIDLSLRYSRPTPWGRFGFLLDSTWLHRLDVQFPDGSVLHGRGTYDLSQVGTGGGVNPALKLNAGVTWAFANFHVAVNTRYLSSFNECGDPESGLIGQGGLCSTDDTVRRRVHAYNAWDLYASYSFRTGVGRTTLAAGINNVFNTPPPTIYSSFWPTSDPMAYDFIGRFFYARLAQRFE